MNDPVVGLRAGDRVFFFGSGMSGARRRVRYGLTMVVEKLTVERALPTS